MNIEHYTGFDENEKPLEALLEGGGLAGIFRTIGCIGDSLSSGEFEEWHEDGSCFFHDMYEYSWGQFMARHIGSKVYNFSKGGMTAHDYMTSFADENGFWEKDKICQAYIIALGLNDMFMEKRELGTKEDIDLDDCSKNADTFAGYYGRIIQKIKALQPEARVFLVTIPRGIGEDFNAKAVDHASLLSDIAELFEYTYLIDFNKYAPVYDKEFQKKYYLRGHLNPAGYLLTARMMETYLDYIIRHHPEDFYMMGFVSSGDN